MDDELAHEVGNRVRQIRLANRQTREVVAGLSGITADYLYQVERGRKLPTLPVLLALARSLRRPASDLLPPATVRPARRLVARPGSTEIHRALTVPITRPAEPVNGLEIGRRIREAWRTWQRSPSRYTDLTGVLPGLIADAEHVLREQPGNRSNACAVELYGLVRTVSKRIGRLDSALLAADRAVRASENAGSPTLRAAAAWNMAHVLLADKQADGAETVVAHAIAAIRESDQAATLDGLAIQGALLSVGSVVQARAGNPWLAREQLSEAAKIASVTGERNTAWTAFGPTSVAMHVVSLELESGEVAQALRLAETVDPPGGMSIERRVAFLLDQARGYVQRRDYHGALVAVQTANGTAPEDVLHRPAAHAVVHAIVRQGRANAARQGAALAEQLGIPV
ncbi:helix-turn-helix domain-containing protein [Actinokineospora globicatena]|uniref:helix-turn-helix domain-containing protein n=1 Tax=Actinokineospora globicatena TaxID=103729 RepID=UPI0020A32FB8|nr:helix-turn-helix transcriptional regulator [Actinokineospora globicatena]MCP2300521.1 DNA-binding transcriptional regulator, XRE-family HTH domain [Actinokineospora globicatena]GLW81064.1 transcriptional regulator [Actinokineospora globicatena]GLW88257.1 transcriptional regulator [Actinokineospora globicatena]